MYLLRLHVNGAARDLFDRLRTLATEADAYVVAAGNLGTLTELFLTWTLLEMRQIPPRPLVLFGAAWRPFLDHLAGTGLASAAQLARVTVAETPEDALAALRVGPA